MRYSEFFTNLLLLYPSEKRKEGRPKTQKASLITPQSSGLPRVQSPWRQAIMIHYSWKYKEKKGMVAALPQGQYLREVTGRGRLCCTHSRGLASERAIQCIGDIHLFKLMANAATNWFSRSVTTESPGFPQSVQNSKDLKLESLRVTALASKVTRFVTGSAEAAAISCHLHSHLWDF